ncbi:hypothetical protein [Nocardioides sp. P5_C9_2]
MSPVELLRSPSLTDSAPSAYASRVGDLSDVQKSTAAASVSVNGSADCHICTSVTPESHPDGIRLP